jgi:hypothetical protein
MLNINILSIRLVMSLTPVISRDLSGEGLVTMLSCEFNHKTLSTMDSPGTASLRDIPTNYDFTKYPDCPPGIHSYD